MTSSGEFRNDATRAGDPLPQTVDQPPPLTTEGFRPSPRPRAESQPRQPTSRPSDKPRQSALIEEVRALRREIEALTTALTTFKEEVRAELRRLAAAPAGSAPTEPDFAPVAGAVIDDRIYKLSLTHWTGQFHLHPERTLLQQRDAVFEAVPEGPMPSLAIRRAVVAAGVWAVGRYFAGHSAHLTPEQRGEAYDRAFELPDRSVLTETEFETYLRLGVEGKVHQDESR